MGLSLVDCALGRDWPPFETFNSIEWRQSRYCARSHIHGIQHDRLRAFGGALQYVGRHEIGFGGIRNCGGLLRSVDGRGQSVMAVARPAKESLP
jgi:hypothetical protein